MLRGGRRAGGIIKTPVPGFPLVSIITVVKNGEASLTRAIEGVKGQTYPNREHIVIDGGSTDGTLDILNAHHEVDLWISEPDRGIYDAMDKGIDLSRGTWLYFLGVDDVLNSPGTLASVFGGSLALDGVDLIVGNVLTPRGVFSGRFGRGLYFKNTVLIRGCFTGDGSLTGFDTAAPRVRTGPHPATVSPGITG